MKYLYKTLTYARFLHTSPIEPMLKTRYIKRYSYSFESAWKAITSNCKMTPVVALDGVISFLRLKDVTYSFKRM